ncbi:LysR family transcriptional regulator [Ideonella sp. B7]|uniref:LysR family transcriptional regulator n=1 Tax=Ideonella benzenivorans TaxID=2831643 RepID=UPI001CED4320|nr:LysR family transcriptional regulator [Ideonella benzenivorans]MCA6215916.1 LysR family transcriptional regulator [Ideonella benzenivorans]
MDVNALLLLVDIVEAGNLSQAARKRKMSRANISYHLTQLEKSLGQQLVRRTTRRIDPTEAGLRLYRHGCVIRDELQAAQESVASLREGLHGSVRLAVPTGFGQLVMSHWLIEFKRLHPSIRLELLFDNRVDDLLRDEVDLAIRVLSEPPPQLIARELSRMRHIVCASRQYAQAHPLPTRLEDLAQVPLITSNVVGRALRVSAYRGEERHEIALQPTLASENFQFLHEAILAGLGVGLVPDYVVARELAAGTVVTGLDDWRLSIFGSRLFLLRMPDRYETLATRTLIDFVLAQAKAWAEATPQAGGSASATLPNC